MRHTQFLCFEVGSKCNLSDHHQPCPSGTPDRYGDLDTSATMTDAEIIDCAREAYGKMGFEGNIAFHYYNEPMLQWDRIRGLMAAILKQAKKAKFTLWTNGTLLTEETEGLDLLDQIWVSNYRRAELGWLNDIVPRVAIFPGHLDQRRVPLQSPNRDRCLRPFSELIIDNFGNGHLCCMDWQGKCNLGNLTDYGFAEVVERFQAARLAAAQQPMADDSPEACSLCMGRVSFLAGLVLPVQIVTAKDKPWEPSPTE